ncbi:LysE/ArgO family amino acid transporter [Gulosibacter bifidus]|uniref:LysE/ArgO family amino acid transporter n=1 Tax=Gulosibacter bifidus TaxID=272239 RepID=A0ABW5RGD7_9MICO
MGALIEHAPWLLELLRWGGVMYLLWFAFTSFRSAMRPAGLIAEDAPPSAKSVLITVVALIWLNPHVYLDTVVMVGSIANQFGEDAKWWFAAGAATGSITWFLGLGYGARALSGILANPRAWRWIDIGVSLLMLVLAVKLLFG